MNIRRRRDPAGGVVIGRSACFAQGLESAISTFGCRQYGGMKRSRERSAAVYNGDCLRHVDESGDDKRGQRLGTPRAVPASRASRHRINKPHTMGVT